MSTIRPPIFPSRPTAAEHPAPAKGSAQRAFFAAAFGAPAATPPTAAAQTPASASPQKIPRDLPADPPSKILRPGSLLDIRV